MQVLFPTHVGVYRPTDGGSRIAEKFLVGIPEADIYKPRGVDVSNVKVALDILKRGQSTLQTAQ